MKSILSWFRKQSNKVVKPHSCNFQCVSWCSHYNQVSEIQRGIENPSWYHYPNINVLRDWIKQGFDYARVMQSHWQCGCGKRHTFFFLAKPSKGYGGRIEKPDTIPTVVYNEMITHNPLMLGSSRGTSMTELTNQLIKELC